MKKLKTLVAVLFTLMIALSVSASSLSASAELISVADMRSYLLSIDIPEEFVDILDDNFIEKMYYELSDGKGEFVEMQTVSLNSHDDVQTRGTIPKEELKFNIVVTYIRPNGDTALPISYIGLYIAYHWEKIPRYLKTDGVIVGWDDQVFTYDSGSFYSYSSCEYSVNNKLVDSDYYEYYAPALIGMDSIGYDVKLAKVGGKTPTTLSGAASLNLLPRQNPMYRADRYTTLIAAQYRHLYSIFKSSVGFELSTSGAGLGVNFATENSTDTIATSVTIKYAYDLY